MGSTRSYDPNLFNALDKISACETWLHSNEYKSMSHSFNFLAIPTSKQYSACIHILHQLSYH